VPNSSLWEESQLAGVSAYGDEFRHLSNNQITTIGQVLPEERLILVM